MLLTKKRSLTRAASIGFVSPLSDDVERVAPGERDAEVLREMVVGADRDDAEDRVGVDQRLDDGVDRAVAAGGDEEAASFAHAIADQRRRNRARA